MNAIFALPRILRVCRLLPFAACLVFAASVQGQLVVTGSVSSLGSGLYQYDFSVTNNGLLDVTLVSLVDAPPSDPLIEPSLTVPAGFVGSYDSGLGIVDLIEGADLFSAGATKEHFLFQSSGAPDSFFSVFEAFDIEANFYTGNIMLTGDVDGAPIPEPATIWAAAILLAGALASRVLKGRGSLRSARADRAAPAAPSDWRGRRPVLVAVALVGMFVFPVATTPASAANHREAPITALDHKADITDVYAFRSYDWLATPRVTLILCVDPLLEPANGPNWFPFDPEILYEINVDNNNDAVADIVFQFRFTTEQRLPNLFQVYAGAGGGITAPANSPPPIAPGTMIVPPQINSFSSPGLGQRQSYTVSMVKGGISTTINGASPFYAVPANVGPRTMDYEALFTAGTYTTNVANVRVFTGTTDDAFWIDLGGAFDTLNTHIFPVLTPAQDAANINLAPDTVSGYAVNSIAIEVPVSLLTRTGAVEAASSTAATIGVWGTTSRPRTTVRRPPLPQVSSGAYRQVQRMGNPLINELLVGTGFKDRFSLDQPKNDVQFASFFLDPTLARVINAVFGGAVAIPTPPRTDLLPLVTYAPPIAAPGTPAGPVADLLRLNTGVPPTPPASAHRLGLLAGDAAGFPNGRRVFDDVTDIALRAVVGVFNPAFNIYPNNALGDGVNANDAPYRTSFPYLGSAPSGRDRRHIDPGEL